VDRGVPADNFEPHFFSFFFFFFFFFLGVGPGEACRGGVGGCAGSGPIGWVFFFGWGVGGVGWADVKLGVGAGGGAGGGGCLGWGGGGGGGDEGRSVESSSKKNGPTASHDGLPNPPYWSYPRTQPQFHFWREELPRCPWLSSFTRGCRVRTLSSIADVPPPTLVSGLSSGASACSTTLNRFPAGLRIEAALYRRNDLIGTFGGVPRVPIANADLVKARITNGPQRLPSDRSSAIEGESRSSRSHHLQARTPPRISHNTLESNWGKIRRRVEQGGDNRLLCPFISRASAVWRCL
jgi:hypothetical protein